MMHLNADARVLIATFSPWRGGERLANNGNLEPMVDFFTRRVEETVLIDQVYPGSDRLLPRIEIYRRKRLVTITTSSGWVKWLLPFLWVTNREGTRLAFKLRDVLSVIDWCIRDPRPYDLFIGFEAVNALAGVIMKRFGRIKRVIYYVSDYSPNRYRNQLTNRLYLWLDRLAAMLSDAIWDVSPAMQPARIAAGLNSRRSAPVLVVPNALYPDQIKQLPASKVQPFSLVFMGTLGEENGPGLAIEAFSQIVKRFPKTQLHIIGGPENEIRRLKQLITNFGLSRIIVHGFIPSRARMVQTLRRCAIALAPYRAIRGSVRWYGDATKIRAYMAAGLPTITTHVPPLGKEVAAAGAAIIVRDDPKDIADAAIEIFSNRSLFLRLRRNAIRFAKQNTWENVYAGALRSMNC